MQSERFIYTLSVVKRARAFVIAWWGATMYVVLRVRHLTLLCLIQQLSGRNRGIPGPWEVFLKHTPSDH